MTHPTPPSRTFRSTLRAYRAASIPVSLGVVYLMWCLWEVRGGDPLLDARIHEAILIGLGIATAVLWPRNHHRLGRLHDEVRALNWRIEEILKPLAKQAELNAFTVGVVQGQLVTIGAKLDAAVSRLDELASDAYADGLAGRNLHDWSEPPTRPISPQVNGLRLNGRN